MKIAGNTRDIIPPRAWILADMSKGAAQERLHITKDYEDLAEAALAPNSTLDWQNLTPADKTILNYSSQWNVDPIGSEDFITIKETELQSNMAFASLHYMILGGHGGQKFHYHPPAGKDLETSIRTVLIYPLWNKDKENGGVTFEWFDAKDIHLIKKEKDDFASAEGSASTPRHKLSLEAGQVAVVYFGKGIHRFKGQALAISGHFKDRATGGGKGAYLDNTAGWKGNIPKNELEIIPEFNPHAAQTIENASLHEMFIKHSAVMKRTIEAYAGKPADEQTLKNLIDELRF